MSWSSPPIEQCTRLPYDNHHRIICAFYNRHSFWWMICKIVRIIWNYKCPWRFNACYNQHFINKIACYGASSRIIYNIRTFGNSYILDQLILHIGTFEFERFLLPIKRWKCNVAVGRTAYCCWMNVYYFYHSINV